MCEKQEKLSENWRKSGIAMGVFLRIAQHWFLDCLGCDASPRTESDCENDFLNSKSCLRISRTSLRALRPVSYYSKRICFGNWLESSDRRPQASE